MDGCMDGWMDGWMDVHISSSVVDPHNLNLTTLDQTLNLSQVDSLNTNTATCLMAVVKSVSAGRDACGALICSSSF